MSLRSALFGLLVLATIAIFALALAGMACLGNGLPS